MNLILNIVNNVLSRVRSLNNVAHHLINLSLALVGSELLDQSSLVLGVIERLVNFMLLCCFWDFKRDIENVWSLDILYFFSLCIFDCNHILY
jgi:hypothetical protein